MSDTLRWVQLWKEGKIRVVPSTYYGASKVGVSVFYSGGTKETLWTSSGDNLKDLMLSGEIDETFFPHSLMEFLQRSGMGPQHRGPGYRDMFDNPRLGAWKLDSVYGATESGEAKSYAEHYKSAGYQTKLVPKGDVIELWIKGSRLFVQEVPRELPDEPPCKCGHEAVVHYEAAYSLGGPLNLTTPCNKCSCPKYAPKKSNPSSKDPRRKAIDSTSIDGGASICSCGHTGDGPRSEHKDMGPIEGHGACKTCACPRFSWARFKPGLDLKGVMLRRKALENPSTQGLTIVGACCILIETTRGRVSGKMGRVLGLPDGSVLIEGKFPKVPGGTVVAVEYMDDAKARAEGEGEGGIPWRHDMESERIALERTQGGLLMRRKNKPLWEMR